MLDKIAPAPLDFDGQTPYQSGYRGSAENVDEYHQVDFEGSYPSVEGLPPEGLPEIAFAGRSNVGKSSCINALLNRKRLARVSQQPGRTRLLNLFTVDQRYRFVDLPGYGYARVPRSMRAAWGPMVEGYLRRRQSLAMLVLLLDIRRDPSDEDKMLAGWLADRGLPVLAVLTKTDKLKRNQRLKRMRSIVAGKWLVGPPVVQFSAPKKIGVEAVWNLFDTLQKP